MSFILQFAKSVCSLIVVYVFLGADVRARVVSFCPALTLYYCIY